MGEGSNIRRCGRIFMREHEAPLKLKPLKEKALKMRPLETMTRGG